MDTNRLKSIKVFADLPDEELEAIGPFATERSVAEGETLVREGDYSYEFIAIEEGTAEVSRDGEHVADLGAGDFFGELGVLEKSMRTATVKAKTPMRIITLNRFDMKRLERNLPAAAERIRDALESRRPA